MKLNKYRKSNPFIFQVMKFSTEKIQKLVGVRNVHVLLHVKDLNLSDVHAKGNTPLQPLALTKGRQRTYVNLKGLTSIQNNCSNRLKTDTIFNLISL